MVGRGILLLAQTPKSVISLISGLAYAPIEQIALAHKQVSTERVNMGSKMGLSKLRNFVQMH